eukprot:GEMP01049434.1.p1 GENE.GEMP01049434.1~~GEMP01049434.1.p1  ORF type:complete len:336 (+),score=51.91 GEMP01049434.1:201-1208(+)
MTELLRALERTASRLGRKRDITTQQLALRLERHSYHTTESLTNLLDDPAALNQLQFPLHLARALKEDLHADGKKTRGILSDPSQEWRQLMRCPTAPALTCQERGSVSSQLRATISHLRLSPSLSFRSENRVASITLDASMKKFQNPSPGFPVPLRRYDRSPPMTGRGSCLSRRSDERGQLAAARHQERIALGHELRNAEATLCISQHRKEQVEDPLLPSHMNRRNFHAFIPRAPRFPYLPSSRPHTARASAPPHLEKTVCTTMGNCSARELPNGRRERLIGNEPGPVSSVPIWRKTVATKSSLRVSPGEILARCRSIDFSKTSGLQNGPVHEAFE